MNNFEEVVIGLGIILYKYLIQNGLLGEYMFKMTNYDLYSRIEIIKIVFVDN